MQRTASGTMGRDRDRTDDLDCVKVTLLLLPKITRSFLKPWTDGVHISDARMQESPRDPANNLKTVASPQTHSSFVCTHDEVDCIACSAQKQDPSLRSLLREAIFVMQAAQYGSLHHPASERQQVSVPGGRDMLRDGLRQTRA